MPSLTVRDVGRIVLVGGLALALVGGLVWAFNPSEDVGMRVSAPTPTADAGAIEETEPPDAAEPEPEPTPEPEPEPTQTGPSPEELIAAAPEPGDTTVQVLDAGGGGGRTQSAVDALRDLGYQVVNVTSARAQVSATTAWYNDGARPAAAALRARDERVVEIAPNEALSTGVDLHLLVGPDWPS